jgi:hypothetical protein
MKAAIAVPETIHLTKDLDKVDEFDFANHDNLDHISSSTFSISLEDLPNELFYQQRNFDSINDHQRSEEKGAVVLCIDELPCVDDGKYQTELFYDDELEDPLPEDHSSTQFSNNLTNNPALNSMILSSFHHYIQQYSLHPSISLPSEVNQISLETGLYHTSDASCDYDRAIQKHRLIQQNISRKSSISLKSNLATILSEQSSNFTSDYLEHGKLQENKSKNSIQTTEKRRVKYTISSPHENSETAKLDSQQDSKNDNKNKGSTVNKSSAKYLKIKKPK